MRIHARAVCSRRAKWRVLVILCLLVLIVAWGFPGRKRSSSAADQFGPDRSNSDRTNIYASNQNQVHPGLPDSDSVQTENQLRVKIDLVNPPVAGSRVALTVESNQGNAAIVCDDALVHSVRGTEVTLVVEPTKSAQIEAAKKWGTINYLIIPRGLENPFAGQAVGQLNALENSPAQRKEPQGKKG